MNIKKNILEFGGCNGEYNVKNGVDDIEKLWDELCDINNVIFRFSYIIEIIFNIIIGEVMGDVYVVVCKMDDLKSMCIIGLKGDIYVIVFMVLNVE